MSATITISPSEIRQIFQPRTSSASRFWELAQKANNLAVIIDARWDQIPPETRELLKIFAYALIEPPQGIKGVFIEFLRRFSLAIALPWIVHKGELDSFVAYNNAFNRLVNAILSGVEREDMAYQKALSEAIEEAFTDWENSKDMSAEEACERLRQISDQALNEL
ncbi:MULTISPECIES: hypothetical protein [unclassified Microcoleus]|uniref:hypothetical protein n=1 Tax=unclassified Microcoleus TaxID=2642155 RepID=UPI002FD70DD0